MRILILSTLLSATPSVAAPAGPGAFEPPAGSERAMPAGPGRTTACKDRLQVIPADTPASPPVSRLGDLPPGDTILAVYREREDGCVDPVIVRYGDGRPSPTGPEQARPRGRFHR